MNTSTAAISVSVRVVPDFCTLSTYSFTVRDGTPQWVVSGSLKFWMIRKRIGLDSRSEMKHIVGRLKFNKKLIRRWDSERELSLRRHRARTTRYNRLVHKFRHRSTRLCVDTHVFTKFSEITQYNGHYVVQSHSRSPILVPIESSYTTSYYWLIVTYLLSCTVSKLWSNFRWRKGSASL